MNFEQAFGYKATRLNIVNKVVWAKVYPDTRYQIIGMSDAIGEAGVRFQLQDLKTGMCSWRADNRWDCWDMKEEYRGKLIFIEGVDSCGKETQTKLLTETLRAAGHTVTNFTFPDYSSRYGELVGKYLNGEYGFAANVDPKLSGSLYTLDRMQIKDEMIGALTNGEIVICDRSTFSNAAFQGTKGMNWHHKNQLFKWFAESEFEGLGLPRPDRVILLDATPDMVRALMDTRGDQKRDQHEDNLGMLNSACRLYRHAADTDDTGTWHKVPTHNGRELFTIAGIGVKVMDIVEPLLQ